MIWTMARLCSGLNTHAWWKRLHRRIGGNNSIRLSIVSRVCYFDVVPIHFSVVISHKFIRMSSDLVDTDVEGDDGETIGTTDSSTVPEGDIREAEAVLDALSEADADATVATGGDDDQPHTNTFAGLVYEDGDPQAPKMSVEWCGTIWPGSANIHPFTRFKDLREFFNKGKPKVIALSAGKEFGSNDEGPHIQLAVLMASTKSLQDMRRLLPFVHNWKPRFKNSSSFRAHMYCLKGAMTSGPGSDWEKYHEKGETYGSYDESKSDVPGYDRDDFLLQLGTIPPEPEFGKKKGSQGDRNDVYAVQLEILQGKSINELTNNPLYCKSIAKHFGHFNRFLNENTPPYKHHCSRGIFIYGSFGVGKSQIVADVFDPNEEGLLFRKLNHDKLFNGYNGEPVILQDEVPMDSKFDINLWKQLCDQKPCKGRILYGEVPLQHRVFVVTSNHSIEEFVNYKYKDSTQNIREKLLGALKRRFVEIEYTEYSRVTMNTKLHELKELHFCSQEKREADLVAQRQKFLHRTLLIEQLRLKGCPEHKVVEVLKVVSSLEIARASNDLSRIRDLQRQYDQYTTTFIQVQPINVPKLPTLKTPQTDVTATTTNGFVNMLEKDGTRYLTKEHIEKFSQGLLNQHLVTPDQIVLPTGVEDDAASIDSQSAVEDILNHPLDMQIPLGSNHDDVSVLAEEPGLATNEGSNVARLPDTQDDSNSNDSDDDSFQMECNLISHKSKRRKFI